MLTAGDASRALPLVGVRNGRDLGGLVGSHGEIPKGHFFRAATLSHATERDKDVLLEHGVKLDLDLRTFWEALVSPDALARDPRFKYVRLSLLGAGLRDVLYPARSRGALYVHALTEHQAQFRQVFHYLATEKDGAVLFHCASGKDRTGMVTALLLALAGVDREAIVHNYVISADYLHPADEPTEVRVAMQESPAWAIEEFLGALEEKFGGARSYLRSIGVSDEDVQALLARLGQ